MISLPDLPLSAADCTTQFDKWNIVFHQFNEEMEERVAAHMAVGMPVADAQQQPDVNITRQQASAAFRIAGSFLTLRDSIGMLTMANAAKSSHATAAEG